MPRATRRDPIYRRRHFSAEPIETCVRWYITYRLSYRDLVAMMAERGITVSHSTILRRYYLCRAVDRQGKSVDSLLCDSRDISAAPAFFRGAVESPWRAGWPSKGNLDGNTATHRALRLLGAEAPHWGVVVVRGRRYLNNIVEQDHRAIKRRCASMLGLKTFRTAAFTLAGVELAHRNHK